MGHDIDQLDPLDPPVSSSHTSSIITAPDNEKEKGWATTLKEKETSGTTGEHRLTKIRTLTALGGRLKLRDRDDDDPTDWWFASTAIPLIAATFAPMANMLSIAALVVFWRMDMIETNPLTREYTGTPFADPQWALNLNGASLACGFVGNAFLLFNFTKKVRYIIALPVTIVFFYLASGILIGTTVAMAKYDPNPPTRIYSQGYWHAVIAAALYMFNAMILMVNMLGYFLGHYPQHFDLNDEQRNLILQTMIFFIWLGGGAGVFARTQVWSYPDALYFCDVTLLTIGFGDFYATNDVGRGLVFPFSVGGTIILGLMVSSIHKFAQELSKDKVVRKHVEAKRVNTLSRVVTLDGDKPNPEQSAMIQPITQITQQPGTDTIPEDHDQGPSMDSQKKRTIAFEDPHDGPTTSDETVEPSANQFKFKRDTKSHVSLRSLTMQPLSRITSRKLLPTKAQKAIVMRDEKDRFDRMRNIQHDARHFKQWYALTLSIISFGLLWCMGAVVFYVAERQTQGLSYFQALYFCYVSLLTIGYGDLSPRSNAGKAFFVLWSLVAVPTMTILVSDLGDTVISGFKRRVLQYGGLAFLGKGRGWGLDWFVKRSKAIQRRLSNAGLTLERGSATEPSRAITFFHKIDKGVKEGDEDDLDQQHHHRTIADLAAEEVSEAEMMRRLAFSIRDVADDLKTDPRKTYTYEEWVEFSRLIRFTRLDKTVPGYGDKMKQLQYNEAIDGIIEWDWLDENSPMSSEQTEPEWIMDRLLESLLRIFRKKDLVNALALADGGTTDPEPSTRKGEIVQSKDNHTQEDAIEATAHLAAEATGIDYNHLPTHSPVTSPGEFEDDEPVWSRRGQARRHQNHQHRPAQHHTHTNVGSSAVRFEHRGKHQRSNSGQSSGPSESVGLTFPRRSFTTPYGPRIDVRQ